MMPWGLLGREGITRPCSTLSHVLRGTTLAHECCKHLQELSACGSDMCIGLLGVHAFLSTLMLLLMLLLLEGGTSECCSWGRSRNMPPYNHSP
jgi:hypothetical protein